MITVSFKKEDITVLVTLMDDNIFQIARDIAYDQGLVLTGFNDLTIEEGRY